jgi:hypothetical protein
MLSRKNIETKAKIVTVVLLKAAIAPVLFDGIYSIIEGRVIVHFAPFIFPFALVAVAYEEWWSRRKGGQNR